ncbi:hypothetical protein BJI69_21100 [Luteibacter rhizovicinus DSM 16549]|jgi:hypothetical protein|uniref:Uncharacterized protein n=1 Tax=Luteibacter rhizovicinus DSM 16549 TaxID=1440763 RepID=A0A0G9H4L2_9GAMM|nr:hypothetical protein [Luteibacter rhizovicinus]APG06154.1 hypothetical protein BJI69_21100 [Luteibacter rhizovicinus DSM 16549]KLD64523.1 hypothetical protein Y883_17785 [Luteibacter rhizovicinus DSM 16549]KLD74243.1 hypothetical protein Y886_33635 [Xanthomonas hyacinthi DSM 19077]
MKAPNLIALTASVLIAGTSVFALRSFDDRAAALVAAPHFVNGVRVVDLPAIQVRPTDADVREAVLASEATLDSAAAAIKRSAEDRAAALIGAQLAMPYYSFGNALRRTAKD